MLQAREPHASVSRGGLGVFLLVLLLGLACRPGGREGSLEDPPRPDAPVVARLDPEGVAPWSQGPPLASPADARVVDFGPRGDVDRETQIYVRFDQAMKPPPQGASPLLRTEPACEGSVRWIDGYQLVLSATLAPGRSYTVIAAGELQTADERPMTLDQRWRVDVERTAVELEILRDDDHVNYYSDRETQELHWKTPVLIVVDRPATLAAVTPHVKVLGQPRAPAKGRVRALDFRVRGPTAREKKEWGDWRFGGDSALFVVEPKVHWPIDTKVQVSVEAGFRATDDEVGTLEDLTVFLETPKGFEVKRSCEVEYDDGCDPGPVFLELSSPVTKRALRSVQVSPRPAKLSITADESWSDGITRIRINGKFKPEQSYAIGLAPGIRDAFGQPLARPFREDVAFVLPAPELGLSRRVGFLPHDQAKIIGVESRWLRRVQLRVAVLDDATTMSLVGRDPWEKIPFPTRGATVSERELELEPKGRFGWSSVAVDLVDFIGNERRAVFVEVTPLALAPAAMGRALPEPVRGLYQVTDLGALALASSANATARVARLSSGEPLAGAQAQLFRLGDPREGQPPPLAIGEPGRTNAQGLAPLPSAGLTPSGPAVMLVRNPDEDDRFVVEVDALDQLPPGPGKGYRRGESVELHAVTERPLYRPGERIRVVGWAAVVTPHTASGLRPVPSGSRVEVVLRDRANDEVLRTNVLLEDYGKLWATLKLPDDAPLGRYVVEATLADTTVTRAIRVKEFRTPPFAVEVSADRGDYLHGATPRITAGASYYFGGRVPIASARGSDECSIAYYRPPGLEERWAVGASTSESPGLRGRRHDVSVDPSERGRLVYSVDLSELAPSRSYRCTSSVGVQDAAAAEVGAAAEFMVHPARYLLLEKAESGPRAGEKFDLHVRTVDYRGERVGATSVRVEVERSHWGEDAQGRWREQEERVKTCTLETTTSASDPYCRLSALREGNYSVVARTTNDDGSETLAKEHFWVGSRHRFRASKRPKGLVLELDASEPKPGDTLTVTLRSPEKDGRGLLTFASGGLRRVEPFTLVDGLYEHRIEVTDAWIPRRYIEAVMVRPATAAGTKLLERADASVDVAHEGRRLQVEIITPELASPRQTLPIAITLRDAAGAPTAGHVALWAVDEAILSLEEPTIPDLVEAFIAHRTRGTALYDDYEQRLHPYRVRSDPYEFGYETISLGNIGTIGKGGGGGSGRGLRGGTGFAPALRRNLETTPIFLGDVVVDESGHANAEGTLPDNLTTYRVTAIASATLVGGDAIGRFGHSDARVRVTAPLVVQAALPRHLRPGDRAQVAALVDNLGGPAGTLRATLTLDDGDASVRITSAATRSVHIAAGAQERIPFDVEALAPGQPAFTLTAVLTPDEGEAKLGDALELTVPVQHEPTLVRRVAVYGSLADDEPVAVAVKPPTGARPGSGGIEVALSSTLLGDAQDMVSGLITYPYGCVEQTASRLLPLAALGKLAQHYPLSVGTLEPWVAKGITRLQSMQTADGGLAYWPGDPHAHAYATAYATWVLQLLEDAGYPVPAGFLLELRQYLAGRVSDWSAQGTPTVDDDIRLAMALVALAQGHRVPKPPLDALYARRERLPTFARALVLQALYAVDHRDARVGTLADALLGGLDERAGAAHVRDGGRWLGAFFDSGPRTEAMVLLALLQAAPEDRRVEKLTRGLMELRHAGAVGNTQERAYALLALAEYARRFEAEVPAFDARVWVGADSVGSDRFAGRAALVEPYRVPLPWAELPPDQDHRVTLSRIGQGRMYYRVAMDWSPDAAEVKPFAAGIAIEHVLRTAAGPVGADDGIAVGELVSLDLTVTTNDAMTYIAIDIPLPPGLEAVDTSLGAGRRAMTLGGGGHAHWVSHSELRPERTLVFADRLSPGEHHHTVPLRAITPGRYRMPPAHAEAMYYPEVQGNSASRMVEIR